MKRQNSNSPLSSKKLTNRKISTSANETPKYLESKIYISTKQINESSLSRTINTKLDLIKQQISRQFNQQYNKNMLRNSSTLLKSCKTNSRSSSRQQKVRINSSEKIVHRQQKSHPSNQQKKLTNTQQQNLQPKRLFVQGQINQLMKEKNLINKKPNYQEKYLDMNQKYLEEKQINIQYKEYLVKFKNRVQQFLNHPTQPAANLLVQQLRNIDQTKFNHQNPKGSMHSLSSQRVSQSISYLLACYQDIQQFKSQLEQLLELTQTRSLEDMKQFIKKLVKKPVFANPKSLDECTFKILELQSNLNQMKIQYQQAIFTLKKQHQIQITSQTQQRKIQVQNFNKLIQKLQYQIHQCSLKNGSVSSGLNHLMDHYFRKVHNKIEILGEDSFQQIKFNQDQKNHMITQFNTNTFQHPLNSKEYPLNSKEYPLKSNQYLPLDRKRQFVSQSSNISYLSKQKQTSLDYKLSSNLPEQLIQIQQFLQFLTNQLIQIGNQAQQNIQKLTQSNQSIYRLDQKMRQIKQEMQDQIQQQEIRLNQKENELNVKIEQFNKIQNSYKSLNSELNNKNNQITILVQKLNQKDNQIHNLNIKIDSLKQQSFKRQSQNHNINKDYLIQAAQIQAKLKKFVEKINKAESIAIVSNRKTNKQACIALIVQEKLGQIMEVFSSHQKISKDYHRQMILKQKQNFQLTESINKYQQKLILLQSQINQVLLQKQQYQFLLNDLRQQFQLYKEGKEQDFKKYQKVKELQLLRSNKTILQANSQLHSQNIQLKAQNSSLNKQLQQKINQRTFYRRKLSQSQSLIQQKDKRLLQLQKQCNKYKQDLQQIQQSLQFFTKNQQTTSKKLITLQKQHITSIQQIQSIKSLNKLLQTQNQKFRQRNKLIQDQNQKSTRRIKQFLEIKQNYQQINIQLRMKYIQQRQINQKLIQNLNQTKNSYQTQSKSLQKLTKLNNQNLSKINQLTNKIIQFSNKTNEITITNKQLNITNNQLTIANNQLTKSRNQLTKTNNQINHKINQLTKTNNQLTKTNNQLNKTTNQLNKTNNQLTKTNNQVKNQIYELKNKNQQLNQMYINSQNRVEILINQIKQNQKQIQALTQKNIEYQQNIQIYKLNQSKTARQLLQKCQIIKRKNQLQRKQQYCKQNSLSNQQIGFQQQFKHNKSEDKHDKSKNYNNTSKNDNNTSKNDNNTSQIIDLVGQYSLKQIKIQQLDIKHQLQCIQTKKLQIQRQYIQLDQEKIEIKNKNEQLQQLKQNIQQRSNKLRNQEQQFKLNRLNLQQQSSLNMIRQKQLNIKQQQLIRQQKQLTNRQRQFQLKLVEKNNQFLQPNIKQQVQLSQIEENQKDNQIVQDSQYVIKQSETQQNDNDKAKIYSQNSLSQNIIVLANQKTNQMWIQQINQLFQILLNQIQEDYQHKVQDLDYFDQIRLNFNKVKKQIKKSTQTLQLDVSAIQYKNSINSPSSTSFYRDIIIGKSFITHKLGDQKDEIRQRITQRRPFKGTQNQDSRSDFSNIRGTGKQFIDHLKQINRFLELKLQQAEQKQQSLLNRNDELQNKLQTLQNQTSIKAFENIFAQLINAYIKDNITKFQQTCRLLMKILRYSQKDIQNFQIQTRNKSKRKKNSSSGFLSALIK